MKESVTKFNLEAAFKALDEIEIPVARKGIAANKVNLKETFNRKSKLDLLLEDYYDVNDTEELEAAKEAREAEVAKAKLARIEKIVDLNAESEEDLLPSYVGKMIIQCPQCMTLFYKNEEDIARSEEDPEVVNVNEVCQHCGNASGYSIIGKVDQVGEEEAEEYDLDAFEDENELDLDFPEGTEEVDPEGTGEDARDDELDLEPVNTEEETTEEDSEEAEEEVKEAVIKQRIKLNNRSLKEAIIDDLDSALYTPGVWGVEFVGEECICFDNEQEARDYFYSLAKSDIYRDSEGIELFKVINEDGDTDTIDVISVYDEEEEVKESLHEDFDEEFLDDEDPAIASRRGPIYVDNDGNVIEKSLEEDTEEEFLDEEEDLEDEEVEETEEVVEEEKVVISAEEVKEIAAEAGEEVAEVVKENPEVEAEEIKEITDEVVDNALEVDDETEEEVVEDEEVIEDEEIVEESLTEDLFDSFESGEEGWKTPQSENLNDWLTEWSFNYYPEDDHYTSMWNRGPEDEDDFGIDEEHSCMVIIAEKDDKVEVTLESLFTYGPESITKIFENNNETIVADIENFIEENQEKLWLPESLTEAGHAVGTVDAVYVVYLDSTDDGGYAGQLWLGDDLDEAKRVFKDEVKQAKKAGLDADAYKLGLYEIYLNAVSRPLVKILEEKCIDDMNSDLAIDTVSKLKKAHCFTSVFEYLNESLTEAVDKELDDKLKAHNEYIEYLKEMIEKEEKSLANAKNDFVKKSIQSRIDALKADLEAALPEALKGEVETELPTPEEVDLNAAENKEDKDEEVKESLNENVIININVEGEKEEAPVIIPVEANVETGCLPEAECPVEPIVEPQPEIVEEPVIEEPTVEEVETEEEISEEELEDEEVIEEACEPLTEEDNFDLSDAEAEELFNSDEFKQPISEEEVESYLDESSSFESVFEEIDELDDESIQNCICESLTEVYSNVENFVMESCEMNNGTFKINGTINFKSGNASETSYVFNEAKYITEDRIVLNGMNETLSKEGNFVLEAKVNSANKSMIANTLSYSYKINNNLVEGLIKNNK